MKSKPTKKDNKAQFTPDQKAIISIAIRLEGIDRDFKDLKDRMDSLCDDIEGICGDLDEYIERQGGFPDGGPYRQIKDMVG